MWNPEFQALFGEQFWLSTIIGVSHWPYDLKSIMERNITGQTEEKFMKEWNNLLNEKFHLKANLSGVFIDSWSQQYWNLPDEDQQKAFKRETDKLWQFASNNEEFIFRTIEDVLEENQKLKEKNQWLNDVITNNISQLNNLISEMKVQLVQDEKQISDLEVEVDVHGSKIENNEKSLVELSSEVEVNENQIVALSGEIDNNEGKISQLSIDIDSLGDQISNMKTAPIGEKQ